MNQLERTEDGPVINCKRDKDNIRNQSNYQFGSVLHLKIVISEICKHTIRNDVIKSCVYEILDEATPIKAKLVIVCYFVKNVCGTNYNKSF